jgi:hypothetical protein
MNKGNRQLERPVCRWEDNIKKKINEILCLADVLLKRFQARTWLNAATEFFVNQGRIL